MADTIEYEEGFDFGGNTSDDANPIVPFRQDAQNLIDIVEAQGMTYENTITIIKALDLTYCPKYAYCFANDKLYLYCKRCKEEIEIDIKKLYKAEPKSQE